MSTDFISNYQLFGILATLSKAELRSLAQFLRSPYYNSDKKNYDLFEILRYYHPQFKSRQFSKERIFWRLFPDAIAYDDSKLRSSFSALKRLIEQFLVAERAKDKLHYEVQLAEVYRERLHFDSYQKKARKAIKSLEEPAKISPKYQWLLFQFHDTLFYHPNSKKYQESHPDFEKALFFLDRLYLTIKLRYLSESAVRSKILRSGQRIILEQAILDEYEQLPMKGILMDLYYRFFQLLKNTDGNQEYYNRTKSYFLNCMDQLRIEEQQELLQFLVNYTINRYKAGEKHYALKQLELHQMALQKELYMDQGQMKFTTFLNIVACGLAAEQLEFVEEFILKYKAFLPILHKEYTTQLAEAYLHFGKKEFEAANLLALAIQTKDPVFILRARALSICCQYEFLLEDTTQYMVLRSSLNQFESYLERNEDLSDLARQPYHKLIGLLRDMAKAKYYQLTKGNAIDKMAFEERWKEEPMINSRAWLLEKIRSL